MKTLKIITTLTILLSLYTNSWATSSAKKIENYIISVDRDIASLTKNKEMVMRNIKAVEPGMKSIMRKYPQIISIMRVNSKGLVVNEIVRNKQPGKKFRKVANQKWFKKVATSKSYYGKIKSRSGKIILFRAFPIKMKRKYGMSFAGAIVAKISLPQTISIATKQINTPIKIIADNKTILSKEWKNSFDAKKTALNIAGVSNIFVKVPKMKKVVQNPTEITTNVSKTNTVTTNTEQIKKSPEPKKISKQPTITKSVKKTKKSSNWNFIITMLLLFIVIIAIIIALVILKQRAKKKHEQLIASIEQDSAPFEYGKTVVMSRENIINEVENTPQTIQQNAEQIQQPSTPVQNNNQDQLRQAIYAEVRLGFLTNLKQYSTILTSQLNILASILSQPTTPANPVVDRQLKEVYTNLQKLRDAIEGSPIL